MSQIMENIASNQYGSQAIDSKCLGKYLKKSEDKLESEELVKEELKQGIQIIKYQLNTLMAIHGQLSCVILYLHLEDNDEYKNENIIIIPKAENIQKKGLSPYPQIIQSKYEPNFGNNFSDFRSIHLPR